jgi:hypothetical protein
MNPVVAAVVITALICITVVTVVLTKSKGRVVLSIHWDKRNAGEPHPVQIQPPAPAFQDISFKRALESGALATGLEELAKRQVEYALGLPSGNAIVRSVELAEQQDKLIIAYERKGSTLTKSGGELVGEAVVPLDQESRRFLPMLKDARTGRSIEFAKGASLKGTNRAGAAALLTGVAHITSGMNVLHGLKEIDRRLSALAEGRSIDQLAELETVYNRISEIFSRPDWKERRADLIASRDQLFKLRATWRRELEQVLESAPETPDTQAAEGFAKAGGIFFPPAFFVGKTLEMQREAEEEKLFGHLANAADLLQRIRLSMLLDISVSQALGEAETLAGVAMRNELEMWDGIVEKFKSKRKGIRTFETPADLQTVEEGLQGYVDMLSATSTMQIQKSAGMHAARKAYAQSASTEGGSRSHTGSLDALAGHGAESSGKLLAPDSDDESPEEKRLLQDGTIAGKFLGSGDSSGDE